MSGFGSFEPFPKTTPDRGAAPRWAALLVLWPVAALFALALVRDR